MAGSAGSGGLNGSGGAAGAGSCVVTAAGEIVTSLDGTWAFTPSGAAATTIPVPGGGWVAQGFSRTSVTAARYDRMVTVPDLGRAQATYLELGAVNHQATLTVDSTMLGTNTTSFTPSVFDVTGAVKPGMAHHFIVDVKGRDALHSPGGTLLVPDGANWSPNIPQGIFRSAVLHVMPALHVADAFVRTDVANSQISIDVTVKNDGTASANGTVSVGLASWNCDANQYPTLPSLPISALAPGMSAKVTVGPVKWGLGASSYWWPNVPYTPGYVSKLHVAAVTVTPDAAGGGAAAAHTVPYRFGFRQVRQVASAGGVVGHYELNGVRFNLRGDNIQGADYDSINNTGKGNGDAYDLFAGFLPPSSSNRGFPGAVDNWEKLNYNGTRIHQVLATPYMLDVMDEMGFLAIGETAIRGEGSGGQDYVLGHDNMVAHLTAMILRDRNHPSIIRWSQCNEAENGPNSSSFQQDLFNAATAADGTRPVSADMYPGGTRSVYPTSPNFAAYQHYPNGTGAYTSSVDTNTTTPFGDGEFIWPSDNSKQGLTWFGTSTITLRQKDASDVRPYTLLSGWAGFIPGVKRTMMTIESLNTNPVFGEDNLPDPWSNPIITRISRAFNPVAVADVAYWDANHASNTNGDWPVSKESVTKGQSFPVSWSCSTTPSPGPPSTFHGRCTRTAQPGRWPTRGPRS